MMVANPDPLFLFSLWCLSGSKSSLWCGSGSCSSSKSCKYATTGLQTLHGSILSLHASIVSDLRPLPSIARLWASTDHEFWLWCGSDPAPALDFDADPDPLPKNDTDLCGSGCAALHNRKYNSRMTIQNSLRLRSYRTYLRKLRHCATG